MRIFGNRLGILTVLAGLVPAGIYAQASAPAAPSIEPGLERAIRWKWQVEPSPAGDWSLPLAATAVHPLAPVPASPNRPLTPALAPGARPDSYVVKKGDALFLIGKRFQVSVARLKEANALTSDHIRVGQILRIPAPEQAPAPTSPLGGGPRPAGPASPAELQNATELATLTLQVFLDRARFSAGPIDAAITPAFQKLVARYLAANPDLPDTAALAEKARAALPAPLVRYQLRAEDFRFIAPPKATAVPQKLAAQSGGKRKPAESAEESTPKPTFDDLTSASMLAYRSAWEFVAERFHCREAYLRKLNPHLKGVPAAGAEFLVPNVVPFAVEAPASTLVQPLPPSQGPVTAAIVDRTRLEIFLGERLVAAMPVAIARPGLRGQGTWTVREAIPHPQLEIRQEARVAAAPTRIYGRETPSDVPPTPTPAPQIHLLAAGPNNPAGVVWIQLAKADDPTALPYGLHGTSIPDEMAMQQSLGGLRLANWDIARALRLLPQGTPLEWRAEGALAP